MNNFWLKLKVWTKGIVFGALLLYILLFVYNNTGESHQVRFWWWFNHEPQSSAFLLALLAFVAGIVTTMLVRTTWSTVRQIQQLQQRNRSVKIERELADMKAKAAMLHTRPTAQPVEPMPAVEDEKSPLE